MIFARQLPRLREAAKSILAARATVLETTGGKATISG